MTSFRSNVSRSVTLAAFRDAAPSGQALPETATANRSRRTGAGGDDAIRREFETLAARIRVLQQRVAREAALLAR